MESGKLIIFETIKTVLIITVTLIATAWFTGSNDIEYKNKSIEQYFKAPAAISKELKLFHIDAEIKNISVLNYGLFNRTFSDHENVDIYLSIKDKKPPKVISSKLYPPERLSGKGITEIETNDQNLLAFNLDTLKKSKDGDYYLINLIFEGDITPEVVISTNNKNLELVEYKKWKDYIWVILIVIIGYAVILAPFIFWAYYSGKRSSNRFVKTLRLSWEKEVVDLTPEQIEHIATVFIKERDKKSDTIAQKFWNKITSKE
jgi:flagellar basal body-associated protein FliL